MTDRTINNVMGDIAALVADDKKEKYSELSKELLNSLSAIDDKMKSLETDSNKYKEDKADIVKDRDSLKTSLRDIGKNLNIDTEGDSWVDNLVKSSAGEAKDSDLSITLQKEIDQMKNELKEKTKSWEDDKTKLENDKLNYLLESEITKSLPKYGAKQTATDYIVDAIKKQAKVVEGEIKFVDSDGTTKRENGTDLTVDDIVRGLKEKEKESKEFVFFNEKNKDSGPAGNDGGFDDDEDINTDGNYVPPVHNLNT